MKKSKIKTKLLCLIACLAMLTGSAFTVSAAEDLPTWTRAHDGAVFKVESTTPAGNYVYGNWDSVYTPDQQAILFAAIDASGVTNGMSEYNKCVAFNNYICSVFNYRIWLTDEEIAQINADDAGLGAEMKADGLRALEKVINGKPAYISCEVYADLFQTMCDTVGISCMFLCNNGLVSLDKNHLWNAVYADGKWYQIDVTNNDQATESTSNRYLMSENGWDDGLHLVSAMDSDRITCALQAGLNTPAEGVPESDSELAKEIKAILDQEFMEKYGRPFTLEPMVWDPITKTHMPMSEIRERYR